MQSTIEIPLLSSECLKIHNRGIIEDVSYATGIETGSYNRDAKREAMKEVISIRLDQNLRMEGN
jgi:hypothetical protein